jgi:ferredoxin-NADP reductase
MDDSPAKTTWLGALADQLVYPLRASHYLELLRPRWATHVRWARVQALHDETHEARTLTLSPGSRWRAHAAGQYVSVGVPIAGQIYTRTYSLSSPPERTDGAVTITVKAVADGRVSQHLVRRTEVGEHLLLGQPQGAFVLPVDVPPRLLFVTAGSGVTPVMSMLRSLEARGRIGDVVHLHSGPTPSATLFSEELEALADRHPSYRLHLVHTRAPGGGRLGMAALEALCPDWRARVTFACGPDAMLAELERHHAGQAELHVERFRAPASVIPADGVGGRVHLAARGQTVLADARTPLLAIAESAGATPRHGCRMGICHQCSTTLISGCVRDLRTGALVSEPGTTIQPCVSAAAGDCAIEL